MSSALEFINGNEGCQKVRFLFSFICPYTQNFTLTSFSQHDLAVAESTRIENAFIFQCTGKKM